MNDQMKALCFRSAAETFLFAITTNVHDHGDTDTNPRLHGRNTNQLYHLS